MVGIRIEVDANKIGKIHIILCIIVYNREEFFKNPKELGTEKKVTEEIDKILQFSRHFQMPRN